MENVAKNCKCPLLGMQLGTLLVILSAQVNIFRVHTHLWMPGWLIGFVIRKGKGWGEEWGTRRIKPLILLEEFLAIWNFSAHRS